MKNIYTSYTIFRFVEFKQLNWLKSTIFIKLFEKLSLFTLTFLANFRWKGNCIIFQHGFVYNHCSKNHAEKDPTQRPQRKHWAGNPLLWTYDAETSAWYQRRPSKKLKVVLL